MNFSEPGAFGTLQAAINVMQTYRDTTYTYVKSCPKYVVGYGSGGVQIIKGKCIYGGIRDLQGIIYGISLYSDLAASLGIHPPEDLGASVGVHIPGNLPATIGTHSPGNLLAEILGAPRENRQLTASIRGFTWTNLAASVGIHSPNDITASIRAWRSGYKDLPASIRGLTWRALPAILEGTHDPSDINAYINAADRGIDDIPAYIRGWQASNLRAFMRIMLPTDLPAEIYPILPGDLSASIRARYYGDLTGIVTSYDVNYLGAYINQIYDSFLPARINPLTDNFKNLGVKIYPYGQGYSDLGAYSSVFQLSDLGALLTPKYITDLAGYLFPVVPVRLRGIIHGWEERFLQGILTAEAYPWDLKASITAAGGWKLLTATISAFSAVSQSDNLTVSIHPWERRDFPAYIFAARAGNLSAYIAPHLQAGDLHASIRPKMIRLTTLVQIPTMVASDLSAIINYPCFRTGYSYLGASIWAKYKGDLYAYIRARIPYTQPTDLGAKIGYTDFYLETDTYKLNIDLLPSKYYTEDIYKIRLTALSALTVLNAYIRPTPRYRDLTASITAEDVESYTYESKFSNRERVIHKTYDGIFQTFETVEMAFKSAVKEYYYSSEGNEAWKASRFDKWMLDVRSILPANLTTRLKRRLHRATTVHDLKRFNSVDEAVKHAIAYVTEYPESNLGATIYNRGRYAQLAAFLNPRYVKTEATTMAAYINPLQDTVVVGVPGDVTTIRK